MQKVNANKFAKGQGIALQGGSNNGKLVNMVNLDRNSEKQMTSDTNM